MRQQPYYIERLYRRNNELHVTCHLILKVSAFMNVRRGEPIYFLPPLISSARSTKRRSSTFPAKLDDRRREIRKHPGSGCACTEMRNSCDREVRLFHHKDLFDAANFKYVDTANPQLDEGELFSRCQGLRLPATCCQPVTKVPLRLIDPPGLASTEKTRLGGRSRFCIQCTLKSQGPFRTTLL